MHEHLCKPYCDVILRWPWNTGLSHLNDGTCQKFVTAYYLPSLPQPASLGVQDPSAPTDAIQVGAGTCYRVPLM